MDSPKDQLDDDTRIEMLRTMLTIREFESVMHERFADNEIPGFLHMYIGEEAIATGVCQAMRENDYLTSTHRGHGHCLARGLDSRKMAAELYGRAEGYCDGKGGSMHIADVDAGMLGANGIVGAGIPIAMGAATASVLDGCEDVAVSFFGDGGLSQGAFHESFNLAAKDDLPLVGIIENNQYGEMSGIEEQHPEATLDDLTRYGEAYGVDREQVDGMDVEAVYDTASRHIQKARAGDGPSLIECVAYRFRGHHEGDSEFYRDKEEVQRWREKDPIDTYPEKLIDEGVLTDEELDSIWSAVESDIEEAVEFARDATWPDPEEAYKGVFAE